VPGALHVWRQVLALFELTGDSRDASITFDTMALTLARSGDLSGALQCWQRALELDTKLGNTQGQGATLLSMASAQLGLKQHARALGLCSQALPLLEAGGPPPRHRVDGAGARIVRAAG